MLFNIESQRKNIFDFYVFVVELRNRAAALELERNSTSKFGPSLSRSRSAQSLKLLGDTATQVSSIEMIICSSGNLIFFLVLSFDLG